MKDIPRCRVLDSMENLSPGATVKVQRIDCFSSQDDKDALIATMQEQMRRRDACVEEYALVVFIVEV